MPTYTLTIAGSPVTLATAKVGLEDLSVSLRTGKSMAFHQAKRHDLNDYDLNDSVTFAVDGTVVFRGRIDSVSHVGDPGKERVAYECRGLRVISRDVPCVHPTTGAPKWVFNVETDDDDYEAAYDGLEVGEIVAAVIDGHLAALRAKGVLHATNDPYVQAELDAMTAVPSNMVFRDLDVDAAIRLAMEFQPGYVFRIDHANQKYRFEEAASLGATTITIGSDDVRQNLLTPEISSRFTAVKIVGGPRVVPRAASVSDGEITTSWEAAAESTFTIELALTPLYSESGSVDSTGTATFTATGAGWTVDQWAGGMAELEQTTPALKQTFTVESNTSDTVTLTSDIDIAPDTYALKAGVSDEGKVWREFQITDADKRNIARHIPGGQWVPCGYQVFRTYKPMLVAKFGSRMIPVTTQWDPASGDIRASMPIVSGDLDTAGAFSAPDDVILFYAYQTANLSARYPSGSAFGGTAYDDFGLERERISYDELWTDDDEQSAYDTLAEQLHEGLSDVVYGGTIPMSGLDFTLAELGTAINIAGQDKDGGAVTTGWEAIAALLHTVRYDFQADTTTISVRTDAADRDPDYQALKELLGLKQDLTHLKGKVAAMNRDKPSREPDTTPPPSSASATGLAQVVEAQTDSDGGALRWGKFLWTSDDGTVTVAMSAYGGGNGYDYVIDLSSPSGVTDHGELLGLDDPADHTWASLIDGTRAFTATVAGVTPILDAHLATKGYVDLEIDGLSATIPTTHDGFADTADSTAHTKYVPKSAYTAAGGVLVGSGAGTYNEADTNTAARKVLTSKSGGTDAEWYNSCIQVLTEHPAAYRAGEAYLL